MVSVIAHIAPPSGRNDGFGSKAALRAFENVSPPWLRKPTSRRPNKRSAVGPTTDIDLDCHATETPLDRAVNKA
jgi:hypothetical protein